MVLLSCLLLNYGNEYMISVTDPSPSMPQPEQTCQFRWQESTKAAYAPRFEQKEWAKHEEDIKRLHAEGRTKREILSVLGDRHGFRPTYGQLRARLRRLVEENTNGLPSSSEALGGSDLLSLDLNDYDEKSTVEPALTKVEEDLFKTFTSILDDGNDITPKASAATPDGREGSENLVLEHHSQQTAMVSCPKEPALADKQVPLSCRPDTAPATNLIITFSSSPIAAEESLNDDEDLTSFHVPLSDIDSAWLGARAYDEEPRIRSCRMSRKRNQRSTDQEPRSSTAKVKRQ